MDRCVRVAPYSPKMLLVKFETVWSLRKTSKKLLEIELLLRNRIGLNVQTDKWVLTALINYPGKGDLIENWTDTPRKCVTRCNLEETGRSENCMDNGGGGWRAEGHSLRWSGSLEADRGPSPPSSLVLARNSSDLTFDRFSLSLQFIALSQQERLISNLDFTAFTALCSLERREFGWGGRGKMEEVRLSPLPNLLCLLSGQRLEAR